MGLRAPWAEKLLVIRAKVVFLSDAVDGRGL
jgi:hypothetical protein